MLPSCLRKLVPAIAALLLSCQERNPVFCRAHPDDPGCADSTAIPPAACASDTDCMKPTPVCDTTLAMCVECTASAAAGCVGTTPVCGDQGRCRGCAADDECASLVCLPDGACAAALDVLYAAPTGSPVSSCQRAAPCSLGRAIAIADGTKVTIRLAAGNYDLDAPLALTADAHLVGRGAVIDRDQRGSGPTLVVSDRAVVALDYVSIEGGDGVGVGVGIGCTQATVIGRQLGVRGNAAAGIAATDCTLALERAVIAGNQGVGVAATGGSLTLTRSVVVGNPGGGVAITGAAFVLENDAIVQNGGPFSLFGGVLITQIAAGGPHVLDFDTIAYNLAEPTLTAGVVCSVVGTPLTFSDSIVYANGAGAQVEGGSCTWTYTDVAPVAAPGVGNRAVDPQFVDPAHSDFHLRASSPVRDAASPTATLAIDLDGDPRPAGGADMGADEVAR